ncbi:MAG: BlaI/MecI/CopY family transcriptional regulator [Candidatus Eremiobacteraeota bacterium]|nr:BlaI/MecI/CopY family transcriptional regulator [Candidatus Eremiobacteraeota bacterium]
MPRKKSPILTDHELRLMEALWQAGRATVAEIVDRIDTPPLAYNTVLTTMRTLEQKGVVAHDELGRTFVYRPLVARAEAAKSAMHHLLGRFFKNSPGALAVTLLDDVRLSDREVARIEQILARERKNSK